jgi:hypothetical protein
MKTWRIMFVVFSLGIFTAGVLSFAGAKSAAGVTPEVPRVRPGDPDAGKLHTGNRGQASWVDPQPGHLVHPCGGLLPEPPFSGLSPLAIGYAPGVCTDGYGDIGVWQAGGHNYVVLSGFGLRMFHLFNVDDPYNPVLLHTEPFPAGGYTGTSAFAFKQGNNHYVSATMRGGGTGCGFFVYNVNDPANPQFVGRKSGTDWCTVHEHFVSTDSNGNADYAWLAMSYESGSGMKMVVLDIRNLPAMTETGRYQRPDGVGFVHDVNVIGNRVYLAHWDGGVQVHDKATLASSTNPTPLNPLDGIRPDNFGVHHMVPTSDGNHLLVQDEFINSPSLEKIKIYNIANINAPFYETGIIGNGVAASNSAHNMRIKSISPGHDLLFSAWYEAGTYGFDIDTTGTTPVVTQVFSHRLSQANGGWNNVWGVDYLPCTVHGVNTTCIYSGDMTYGLVVDALGYYPAFDPYLPESTITSPTNGQTISACSVTIQGTAHDYYSGLNQVEVSTDNGATWHTAVGTTSWTYQWTITADGPYTIKARALDVAANYQSPLASVSVNVAYLCGGNNTPTPTNTVPPTLTSVPTSTATNTPVPTSTASATSVPCTISFSDVGPTDYFYEPVRALYCAGAISGYADNTFRPYNNTTRGQVAKIVVLASGLQIDTSGGPHFTDVISTNPFYTYVETAYNRGIISGYDDGTFKWGVNVTRGQLSKIVVLAEGWALDLSGGPHFTDVPSGHPFYGYIETAFNKGIISGYDGNTFHPADFATRGQIAKIVHSAVSAP